MRELCQIVRNERVIIYQLKYHDTNGLFIVISKRKQFRIRFGKKYKNYQFILNENYNNFNKLYEHQKVS